MKNYVIFLAFVFCFSACQENAPVIRNSVAESPTNSQNITQIVSVPDSAKIKTFDGKGIVTKINLEIGSVEMNHEEIKGLMPAMIMEFYVSDKTMLSNLRLGDKVDFVLEDNAGAEKIIKIVKR